MSPEEFIRESRVDEALAAAKDAVKSAPGDPDKRIALFQLFALVGKWDSARNQLSVIAELTPESSLFASTFAPVVACEEFRQAVFAGERSPVIFGDPEPWISSLVEANRLVSKDQFQAASELRNQAFEEAAPSSGTLDGEEMEWLADADPRLGPVLELIMEEAYRWVPFDKISKITLQQPKDLRDLIWLPAELTWKNGGQANGLIPVRYPSSESSDVPALQLARKTEWQEHPYGYFIGRGQRQLVTNFGEKALLDAREIIFNQGNSIDA